MSEKVTLQYRITGIQEFPEGDGYVAVYMEPVQHLGIQRKAPKINIQSSGGKSVPREIHQAMQMFAVELEESLPRNRRKDDPRDLIHVEPMIDFIPRGWRFGDIVNITIEKVVDVNDIDPSEFEVQQ